MKLLLGVITAILLLTGSFVYLSQYETEQEVQAYERLISYNSNTGYLTWNLNDQTLDTYQMESIQKTMERKYIQNHINSNFITHVTFTFLNSDIATIRPILDAIPTAFDNQLVSLEFDCSTITKVNIDVSFNNWKLPSHITEFKIKLNNTLARNFLLSMQSNELLNTLDIEIVPQKRSQTTHKEKIPKRKQTKRQQKKKQPIYRTYTSYGPTFNESFKDISFSKLKHFNLTMKNYQDSNISEMMNCINRSQLQTLSLNFSEYNNIPSRDIVFQLQKQRNLIDFKLNLHNNSAFTSTDEFTEKLIEFLNLNPQMLNAGLDFSSTNTNQNFITKFEEYLFNQINENLQLKLNIQDIQVPMEQAIEMFRDSYVKREKQLQIIY